MSFNVVYLPCGFSINLVSSNEDPSTIVSNHLPIGMIVQKSSAIKLMLISRIRVNCVEVWSSGPMPDSSSTPVLVFVNSRPGDRTADKSQPGQRFGNQVSDNDCVFAFGWSTPSARHIVRASSHATLSLVVRIVGSKTHLTKPFPNARCYADTNQYWTARRQGIVMSRLFQPISVGPTALEHRVAMAPLTRYRWGDDWDATGTKSMIKG